MSVSLLVAGVMFLGCMFLIQGLHILKTGKATPFFMVFPAGKVPPILQGLFRRLVAATPCIVIGCGALAIPAVSAINRNGTQVLWERFQDNMGFEFWMLLFLFGGVWSMVNPRGLLAWAKIAKAGYPRLDSQVLAIARIIGVASLLFSLKTLVNVFF